MSVLQVINRILPTSVLPEDFSKLVTPDDFGHPSKVQTLCFVDPRNGQHFVIQSTFCPRKLNFSGKNIHEEIAATCERIPGLICITNQNSVQDTLNKECTGEEFALTIPNSISKHEIFEQNILSNGKTKIEASGSSVNCDNKLDDDLEQLKKMTACKPADVNDHKLADVNDHKPADVNDHKLTDVNDHKPADVNDHKPEDVNDHKPADVNDHKPADVNDHKPADVNDHKPADVNDHKPADVNDHKPADVNDHKPTEDQNKRRKLLLPLVKYFLENECLICGFHGEHITKHNACKHMLSHIRLGSYFCNDQFFTSAANLYSYAINQPERKTYFCNLCGAKYKRKIFLRVHKKNKHVKSDSYSSDLLESKHYSVKQKISSCFTCVVCNEKFTSLKSVIDHRNVHLGKGRYRCLTCSKIFTSIYLVRYHSHVRIVIKSYKCGICDKRFLSNHSLKVHRNSHMKKMLFSCKWCEKKFYIRNNLMEHLELSHTNY